MTTTWIEGDCDPCRDGDHAGDLDNPGFCDCCGRDMP